MYDCGAHADDQIERCHQRCGLFVVRAHLIPAVHYDSRGRTQFLDFCAAIGVLQIDEMRIFRSQHGQPFRERQGAHGPPRFVRAALPGNSDLEARPQRGEPSRATPRPMRRDRSLQIALVPGKIAALPPRSAAAGCRSGFASIPDSGILQSGWQRTIGRSPHRPCQFGETSAETIVSSFAEHSIADIRASCRYLASGMHDAQNMISSPRPCSA